MFNRYDVDHSGSLDVDEFRAMVAECYPNQSWSATNFSALHPPPPLPARAHVYTHVQSHCFGAFKFDRAQCASVRTTIWTQWQTV